MEKPRIGIIGNGFVGSAAVNGFSLHAVLRVYDVDLRKATHTIEDTVLGSDFLFVSVPTPMKHVEGGEISLDILDSVVAAIVRIIEKSSHNPIIIIRSTVVPGTVEKYIEQYPMCRFVFNPEFLTERNANLDFINAPRIILGGASEDTAVVERMYRARFPYRPIICTDVTTAQFIKYMANCFLASKVALMNEFYQIAQRLGVSWNDALKGFILDGRIGNSHIDVPGHDGQLGFGGKCFPKDLNAFIHCAEKAGWDPRVLKAVWDLNLKIREVYDWAEIAGAVETQKTLFKK